MSFHSISAEYPLVGSSTNEDTKITANTDNDYLRNVCQILDSEPLQEAPIDINISKMIPVDIAPSLNWVHFDESPKKMKITNTGHSVILSAKWGQERPYITNSVLPGKYVFSQMHFHWGVNDMEGSEHTFDGRQYPGELHVVLFKSCYLTQESALKERDGVAILVYILNLQQAGNPMFQEVVRVLPAIAKAHTSAKITPVPLNNLITPFDVDYFIYKGSITTVNCVHPVSWIICRYPIGISSDQMDSFRFLLDNDDEIIKRNFRPMQPTNDRYIFHILPSTSKYATLLQKPLNDIGDKIMQIYRMHVLYDSYNEKKSEKSIIDKLNDHKIMRNMMGTI
ncbi:hypothetical protein ABEB36_013036 [Hypothenemus hampei]|uniref:Alpha-carbonic anhydrase domain-containing protein n=1 Tax=Hypothenemus hampei TaxID=57062 RepID=A0ABD1E7H4_HYPHA